MDKREAIHLAIIPDGNRRWAKKKGLHPWKGHEQAIGNIRSITEWCRVDPRIVVLTVWCFSTENWKRDSKEVAMLMTMLEDYLKKEGESFIEKHTRFLHSGRRDRLPPPLAQVIEETEEKTKHQKDFVLNLAVDYGGKDEVIRAMQKCSKPSEEEIRNNLDHPELPDIDLIVRTSGEKRTSNFALWQSTYAEWIFSAKLFPDFTVEDLASTVDEYQDRQRRFGA